MPHATLHAVVVTTVNASGAPLWQAFLREKGMAGAAALVLLALRLNLGRDFAPHAATAGGPGGRRKTIDGEYRRLD